MAVLSSEQDYPNPLNPTTEISLTVYSSQFTVHRPVRTTLTIYNLLGQKVRTLTDEPMGAVNHEVIWDGKDDTRGEVASGVYFYQLKAGDHTETRKMVLLK